MFNNLTLSVTDVESRYINPISGEPEYLFDPIVEPQEKPFTIPFVLVASLLPPSFTVILLPLTLTTYAT